jgi:hypothetical protein
MVGSRSVRNRLIRSASVAACSGVAVLLVLQPGEGLAAQTPAQAYTAARTPDGRPDLQGIWQAVNTAVWDIQDHGASPGVPAGQGVVEGNELPYLPSALAKRRENFDNRTTEDPEARCHMVGVPRIMYMPYPVQIFQTPQQVTIVSEYAHTVRNIRMDSSHPPVPIEWYMGDSRGRWEGETLVVDVIHFTDQTWFDRSGNYHSEALHVVERYTPTGPDHLLYEATIEDPKVFSRPWKMSMTLYRRKEPGVRLLEYECYAFLELYEGSGP